MDKDVHLYKQRGDTCAIACMMMVLEYYKIIEKANWYDEKRYYKIYGSKYINGTPFSALAFHFSKNGLDTTIYHSNQDLFCNDKGAFSDYDFKYTMDEYKEFLDKAKLVGTKVVNGIEIGSELLKETLVKGNLVVLAGKIHGGYHAILISGYEDDCFLVCDPLYKVKQRKTKKEIDEFMNTSIGKWFISVGDKIKVNGNLIKN